jgi:hypothetical protein
MVRSWPIGFSVSDDKFVEWRIPLTGERYFAQHAGELIDPGRPVWRQQGERYPSTPRWVIVDEPA